MPNANLFAAIAGRIIDRDRTAIETGDGKTYSYGTLLTLSAQYANMLVALGLKPGDRVAMQAEKSVPALVLYLATIRAGGVFLPLNTAYTANEVAYFLRDAEPRIVVCDPSAQPALDEISEEIGATLKTMSPEGAGTFTGEAAVYPMDFETVEREPDDLAAILYTSGTTGRSKGAMLSHDNLLSNAMTLIEHWRFTSRDVLLHALPIYHTHGLFVASNVSLLSGGSMIFLPRFDVEAVVQVMQRATVMMGVPTFYTRLLGVENLKRAAQSIRVFISGSAPLLAETHQQWTERTGQAILERYGMTETNMITSNPYEGERVPGKVGPPLPGVEIRVVDQETGSALPAGEIGTVEVRGPNVFKGYWRMPEKTKSEFRDDGFFITGDLGFIDDHGYLKLVGRGRDLVISGGLNVYPVEVETEIDLVPGVAESAIIGVPHADLGEAVVAVVVREQGADVSETDITAALTGKLARFKQPRRIVFVDELPRNTMGKVQKNLLRERFATLSSDAG